jgi:archaellum component FlaC
LSFIVFFYISVNSVFIIRTKMSDQDEDYKLRRERNNESVKRCRENEKKKIENAKEELERHKNENKELERKCSSLEKELETLKSLFRNSASAPTEEIDNLKNNK